MSFYDYKQQYKNIDFEKFAKTVCAEQIKTILNKDEISEFDFLALLSPAALDFIEPMAQKAADIALKHFGKAIVLFAPLYASNFCINNCAYCGFSTRNDIERKILNLDEVEENAKIVSGFGIRHILLLTGESAVKTSMDYLKSCVKILKRYFDAVDIEIYPLTEDGYKELGEAGVEGLTVFQETYNEDLYKILHTKGAKANYRFRLETCERAGRAGYRNLNIGALLGLDDFSRELFFTGIHAKFLQKNFPSSDIGVSFPRIRKAEGGYQPRTVIADSNLVQAIAAIRLFVHRIGITISTRENNDLRRNLIGLGITKMSAASNTQVGGYAKKGNTKGQFEISDSASVKEVKDMIYQKNYQPVLKDWMQMNGR
ncbi:MAG: 2-iminoacetate synthase ThiH [Elusimicrobiota bacterium]|jgi:2-iminoacetate synthase|nr:2-iminoacetate synthase ThiH [Elusimicrobiota bacterium]